MSGKATHPRRPGAKPGEAGTARRDPAPSKGSVPARHAVREVHVDGRETEVLVDLQESPLGWLARRADRTGRPMISPVQMLAGERLRLDFTRAGLEPRVTTDWSGLGGGGGSGGPGAFSDAVLGAKARVSRALTAVGPELSGVLLDVCCFLKGLEAVERERGWPARTAKVVLGLGLDRLAAHYGLSAIAEGPASALVRAWHGADPSDPPAAPPGTGSGAG